MRQLSSLLLAIAILLLPSCTKAPQQSETTAAVTDTLIADTTASTTSLKPIWGYRFQITGDFDGDGSTDTLQEHYFSKRDGRETNKYYEGSDDFFLNFDSADAKQNISFVLCTSPGIDTLPAGGITGLVSLRNEGDLDGDGGDEVSYVGSQPQMSSMNSCGIYSWKRGEWKIIGSFEVREWQFPTLPSAGPVYGLFGSTGVGKSSGDAEDKELQEGLESFAGLITKVSNGKVKVETFDEEAMDTVMMIELKVED